MGSGDDSVAIHERATAVERAAAEDSDDVWELAGGSSRSTNDLDAEVLRFGLRRRGSGRKRGERKEEVLKLHGGEMG